MALSDLTDSQLHNLNGSSLIPPQVINAEILRRSQMTNSAGALTKTPAMANAATNPVIAENPLLQNPLASQGIPGFQAPAAVGQAALPNWNGASAGNFGYGVMPDSAAGAPMPDKLGGRPELSALNTPNNGGGIAGSTFKTIRNWMGANADDPTKVTSLGDTPSAAPDASALNADNAAQLAFVDKIMGGLGGGHPPLVPGSVKPDYQKYYDQVAKEMPDNTGDLKDAIKAQRGKAQKQGDNALSQGLMSAGLSMLGSRQPFFQALGDAGKQGLTQYNAQKDTSDQQMQRLLGAQATASQIDQGRQAAISQGASARGMEDVRAQQDNARNQIAAYSAQFGPAMVKAQMMGARLALMKDPIISSATDMYQRQVGLAGELMKSMMPGAQEKALQLELNARKIYEAAISHRASGIGTLLPEQQTPAGMRQ